MKAPATLLVVLAVTLFALSAGLRPDAFYAGDPGVKLTAARHAAAHPSDPFDLPLPTIAGTPVPHVEPFFSVHDNHTHAVTAEIFPVLTAPFLRLVGIRGIYLLPAFGYLLAVAGCMWLAVTLDARRQLVVGLVAALAAPWLFYGLEFWEHTLALGLIAIALPLLVGGRGVAAGACAGIAILLRAEAAWLALLFVACSPLLPNRPSRLAWLTAAAGAAVVIGPYTLHTWRHFGTFVPLHLAANQNAAMPLWSNARAALVAEWFGWSRSGLWRAAPALLLAAVPLASDRRYEGRRFLIALALADIALVALTAPNSGGAQWGPRYLLFACIPLTILAADAAQMMTTRRSGAIALAVVAGLAIWTDRAAYKELRAAKNTYGRVVDFVAQQSPPGGYVVSDVWWLDQVAAASASERQWLFVPDNREGRGVVKRLSDATVPLVTLIRAASGASPSDWAQDSCYFVESTSPLPEQDLLAVQLRHRCGSGL